MFITIFLLILYSIEQLLYTGIRSYDYGQIGKVNKIMKHDIDPELPIFGSSVANFHFNPSIITPITGFECYNFGLTATPLIHNTGLLEEYLRHSASSMIVIATTVDELAWSHQVYELNKYVPYLDNSNIYNALAKVDQSLFWKLKNIPFYSYSTFDTNFYVYAFKGLTGIRSVSERNETNGFFPINSEWDEEKEDGTAPIMQPINRTNIIACKEIIRKINNKGKIVILVLPPIYYKYQERIKNLNEVKEVFKKLAGDKNIFMDFTTSGVCMYQDNFYDNTHLNADGAMYFSEEFAYKLAEITRKSNGELLLSN